MYSGLIRVMCADPSGIVGSDLNLDWQSLDDCPCILLRHLIWRGSRDHYGVEYAWLWSYCPGLWSSGVRHDAGEHIDLYHRLLFCVFKTCATVPSACIHRHRMRELHDISSRHLDLVHEDLKFACMNCLN